MRCSIEQIGERVVLIDWAHTGLAPLGCHAASLIALTSLQGDVPGDRFDEFHGAVAGGYADGLRSVGSELPSDDLRYTIDVALTLRLTRFLTRIHAAGDKLERNTASVGGRAFTESMRSWTLLANHLVPSAERALAGVDR